MIKSISLRKWKSFESARLWVDPLTFIIGTNSAGKSNIVDALSFLASATSGTRFSDITVRGGIEGLVKRGEEYFTLELDLLIGKEEFTYTLSLDFEDKELLLREEKLVAKQNDRENKTFFETSLPPKGAKEVVVQFQKEKAGTFKAVTVSRDRSILYQLANLNLIKEIKEKGSAVASCISSIFILDPKPEMMRSYTPKSDKLASDGSNIAGYIAGLSDEGKKDFEDKLTDYVRPLPERDIIKIWAEPIGRFKSDAMLYCAEEWTDGKKTEFDARSMSDGTLRFIAIISALLAAREGSTIVIEEVDKGLHPSRAGELVMALKDLGTKRGVDIICTTHNPVLIDALGPEMLPFISYVSRSETTGNSEIHLLEDVPHLLKLLASYTPGDLMTKGYLSNEQR